MRALNKTVKGFFSVISAIIMLTMPLLIYVSADPPHDRSEPNQPVSCNACHTLHGAPGSSLTQYNFNANLCTSCHVAGEYASEKPFAETMGARPGISGTSHNWSTTAVMPATSSPANQYGLRATADLTNIPLKTKLGIMNDIATCSICHNESYQSNNPWDASSSGWNSTGKNNDWGTATAAGTTTTLVDLKKAWITNQWTGYYVKFTSGQNLNQRRRIIGNIGYSLRFSTLPYSSWATNAYYIATARHYMRVPNDLNQLCEDCHYYRVSTHTRVEGSDGGYPANGANVFSHPVGQGLNANGKGYDRPAPLDVNGAAQSGPRWVTGGESPDNTTNNLISDSQNKVRCMTCHRIHYTDSNGMSNHVP